MVSREDRQYDEDLRYWEDGEEERLADIGRMTRTHFDEVDARNTLRPRTGQVTVQPRSKFCACGAIETGFPHPGHRYRCTRYAKNPLRDAA